MFTNTTGELKFRAYDRVLNQSVDVRGMMLMGTKKFLIVSKRRSIIKEYTRKFSEVDLMHYSTLNDKKGRELFDGDVIEFPENYIFKNNKYFYAVIERVDGNFYAYNKLLSEVSDIVYKVGNIYEDNARMIPKLARVERKKWRM